MLQSTGLVFACLLDGNGGGQFGDWDMVRGWSRGDGLLWVHLDFRAEGARQWVRDESGLSKLTETALLADQTRPRSLARDGGLLVDLRGVNLNPGAQPDDMISIRAWLEEDRIITLRHRHLATIEDLKAAVLEGRGPTNSSEFLLDLGDQLIQRMSSSFGDLDQRVDSLQERIGREPGSELRAEISTLRNRVIALRRYLAPQRDAIARMQGEKIAWLTDVHRERLRDLVDRTTRHVEDLEAARDRVTVAHEELTSHMAEQMNRTMYTLAIVAGIFLPLGVVTGLLGINVGGIPGIKNLNAFWYVCAFLVVLALFQWWIFKRMRWL